MQLPKLYTPIWIYIYTHFNVFCYELQKAILDIVLFVFLFCLSQDQHLHNFFQYCQKTESGARALGTELVKYLKV